MLANHVHLPLLVAVALLSPSPSFGQLNVITSVGFAAAYSELVPAFQKSSGITVSTKQTRSKGTMPTRLTDASDTTKLMISTDTTGTRAEQTEGRAFQ